MQNHGFVESTCLKNCPVFWRKIIEKYRKNHSSVIRPTRLQTLASFYLLPVGQMDLFYVSAVGQFCR